MMGQIHKQCLMGCVISGMTKEAQNGGLKNMLRLFKSVVNVGKSSRCK